VIHSGMVLEIKISQAAAHLTLLFYVNCFGGHLDYGLFA